MMGGDFAPEEAVKGIRLFLSEGGNAGDLVLLGNEEQILETLVKHGLPSGEFRIVHAPETIGMHEHPTKALKEKPLSSISIGFGLLAKGEVEALISAGNTGAMMVGALFSIKAMPGVLRPTIGAYMPRENGKLGLLVDVGINADCKPENLAQFALLGTLFVKHIWNIEEPRVGLINIGEEEGKGNILAQAAYPLLKAHEDLHFIGNIEGRDILMDQADVMVCEGFTGNIVLKMAESFYDIIKRRKVEDPYFEGYNFEQYGGVPVLGVAKPVIIGHGISKGPSFKNMIRLAYTMIEKDLIGKMRAAFEKDA